MIRRTPRRGSVGRVHFLLVAPAAVWGLASGVAVARVPWREWITEPTENADDAGAEDTGSGLARWLAPLGALISGVLAQVTGARPELVVWLLLVPVGMLLARIDLAVRRLPDVLTLPTAVGTAVALGGAALVPGHEGSWPRALLGGVVLGAGYFVLLLINPAGMGFGDVKLAPTLGLALGWYGWPVLFAGTFLAFGLGAVTGIVLMAARRAGRKTALSFGPFMLVGALGGLLLGAL